jgi:hypothetical protein
MSNGQGEKRRARRSRVDISVVCSRVTGDPHGAVYSGRIASCSRDGLCIEVAREFAVGTVLAVRAVRQPGDSAACAEVPSLGVAQVRWSRQKSGPSDACFRVGLKYIML